MKPDIQTSTKTQTHGIIYVNSNTRASIDVLQIKRRITLKRSECGSQRASEQPPVHVPSLLVPHSAGTGACAGCHRANPGWVGPLTSCQSMAGLTWRQRQARSHPHLKDDLESRVNLTILSLHRGGKPECTGENPRRHGENKSNSTQKDPHLSVKPQSLK